jgi:hypothetical protein
MVGVIMISVGEKKRLNQRKTYQSSVAMAQLLTNNQLRRANAQPHQTVGMVTASNGLVILGNGWFWLLTIQAAAYIHL